MAMAMSDTQVTMGTVQQLYRYPVKSMQGMAVDALSLGRSGVAHDRGRALIDVASGTLMSAKRWSKLLQASADDEGITLPDGTRRLYGAEDMDAVLSSWLGREVALRVPDAGVSLSVEMTFDPPNDEAEYYEIPAPPGTFVDLSPLHVVCQQTLDGGAADHPELDWDVRRFRPNLLVDAPGLPPFGEDGWCGMQLRIGTAVVEPQQPTVRCAMPLRAQPGLAAQPLLFQALDGIHANHLGIYVEVTEPGEVRTGDQVRTA
jgi:uncharacterized protein YcbX